MTLDLPGTLFLQIVGLLREFLFYVLAAPFTWTCLSKQSDVKLIQSSLRLTFSLHVRKMPSTALFCLCKEIPFFGLETVAALLDNVATRASLHDETDQEELPRRTFLLLGIRWRHRQPRRPRSNSSPFARTFLVSVMADRHWRKTRLRKSDFQWELGSQIWYVYLLAIKHSKNRKTQIMLDLITVAL